MSKKVTILCPYCFKSFQREEVQIQCKNYETVLKMNEDGTSVVRDICPPEEDAAYNNYWKTRSPIKHIFDANLTKAERGGLFRKPQLIQAKKCPQCGILSQNFVCPHCHNRLPTEMIEKGSEIISVVGGPASGKSNYIVTLIHDLRKYGNKLGLNVTLQQVGRTDKERTTNMYKAAEKIIFEDHFALEKTSETPHAIPWIIRLESKQTEKAVYLVFYDTAGEAFKSQEKIARDVLYFEHSKAVIVALDTLAVPQIKKILQKNNVEVSDQIYDYKEMLDTIKAIDQSDTGHDLTLRPYAFVFTKFDTVIDNAKDLGFGGDQLVNRFVDDDGRFVNSSYMKDGKVKLNDMKECNDAIVAALNDEEIWDQSAVVSDVDNWNKDGRSNGMFFGVSALGGMEDGTTIKTDEKGEVRPIRVLDPLVWILIKLGGFGIKTE